jgi:hypothetical protein
MTTQCNRTSLAFQPLGSRDVLARFDGGTITSDGGVLLLGEVEAKTHILQQFTNCFTDHRDPDLIEHPGAARVSINQGQNPLPPQKYYADKVSVGSPKHLLFVENDSEIATSPSTPSSLQGDLQRRYEGACRWSLCGNTSHWLV